MVIIRLGTAVWSLQQAGHFFRDIHGLYSVELPHHGGRADCHNRTLAIFEAYMIEIDDRIDTHGERGA